MDQKGNLTNEFGDMAGYKINTQILIVYVCIRNKIKKTIRFLIITKIANYLSNLNKSTDLYTERYSRLLKDFLTAKGTTNRKDKLQNGRKHL